MAGNLSTHQSFGNCTLCPNNTDIQNISRLNIALIVTPFFVGQYCFVHSAEVTREGNIIVIKM